MIELAEKKNVTALKVPAEELEPYEDQFRAALKSLKSSVGEEKQTKLLKSRQARHKTKPGSHIAKDGKKGRKLHVSSKKRNGAKSRNANLKKK